MGKRPSAGKKNQAAIPSQRQRPRRIAGAAPSISPRLQTLLVVCALLIIMAGSVALKLHLIHQLPFFDPQNGEDFFWTESAFHFRHFTMISDGRGIPPVDYGIQHPEGLDTRRYITPVMERVAGSIHRHVFPDTQPHLFAMVFSVVVSAFSLVAVFFATRFTWGSTPAALIAALIYAVIPASFYRTAGGGFVREDFALPLIFMSFAAFMSCLRKDSLKAAVCAAALLIVALAAWHVTQLYLSLFVAALWIDCFVRADVGSYRKSLLVLTLALTAAAVLLPVLRAKHFLFSPAVVLSLALTAVGWLPALRKGAGAGLLLAGALAGSVIIQRHYGTYSHVCELLLAKIRYLGVLPENPASLSFEAKSMWTSAFVCPQLAELPLLLSLSLVFGPLGLAIVVHRVIKRANGPADVVIGCLAGATFVLFLMIHRMSVFAVFFLVLAMGALVQVRRPFVKHALCAAVGICVLIHGLTLPSFTLLPFRPNQADLQGLTRFIASKTDPETAVLTAFELGPALAAYTGHPVVLHSKFESQALRDKVKRVYTALYEPEEQFYLLCRSLAAGLFVYQTNMVLGAKPGSLRHMAGAIPLTTDSAAFQFHFTPERLQRFSLIYQNGTYRVFRIAPHRSVEAPGLPYHPIYDLSVFVQDEAMATTVDDSLIEGGLKRLGRAQTHLDLAQRFMQSLDYETAIIEYERAMSLDPANPQATTGLVLALDKAGRHERLTTDLLQKAVADDPQFDPSALNLPDADLWIALAQNALSRTQHARAEALFEKARSLAPASEVVSFGLASALWAQGKTSAAEAVFRSIVSANPNHYQAYESLGKIYAVRGQTEKALECAQASLRINPAQPHLRRIVEALQTALQQQHRANQDFEVYVGQADRLLAEENWKGAKALYLEAARVKKTHDLLVRVATASHRMGQDDEAIQYLREAIAMEPGSSSAKSLLKEILIGQNLTVGSERSARRREAAAERF